jgi:hypothetical protein
MDEDKMKTIIYCGCSYMWSSCQAYYFLKGINWPDQFPITKSEFDSLPDFVKKELKDFNYNHSPSFLDMYGRAKNFNQLNLAKGGASNFAVRIQIEEAIKLNPDYVIVGGTHPDRFEIPVKKFDLKYGVRNFDHDRTLNFGSWVNKISKINTEIFTDLSSNLHTRQDNMNFVKIYKTIQNVEMDELKSYYFLQNGLDQLEKNKISYLFLPGPMKHLNWENFNIWPNNKEQPWDSRSFDQHNHHNFDKHELFFNTLMSITPDWK